MIVVAAAGKAGVLIAACLQSGGIFLRSQRDEC
jgi:hypothetical protein